MFSRGEQTHGEARLSVCTVMSDGSLCKRVFSELQWSQRVQLLAMYSHHENMITVEVV